jgi:N,N'-diacetyllegionaminate synthase
MRYNFPDWPGWPKDRVAIIAEVGINHGGDEDLAWEMINKGHANGADFVKLQSYITEEFLHPSLEYFDSTKSMELSSGSQRKLFKRAKEAGINLITTTFDFKSVDMIEELDPPLYKIASMDNDNIPLIRYIAEKGRPVLISCGMADLGEIERVVNIMKECSNDKYALLYCISDYPAKPENMNLSMINLLRQTFGCAVGLSDHSIGLIGPFLAASLEVAVIEKHFTTDRLLIDKIPDADHDISIVPSELRDLRKFCESVSVMMGKSPRTFTENEIIGRLQIRRGLYAKRDLEIGEKLSAENTILLRPVKGIKAGYWDLVKGKKVERKISRLQPVLFSDLGM